MLLYLYLINGTPRASSDLSQAQTIVGDKLKERRDVSDVWWYDDHPYIPRQYLYGASHSEWLAAEEAGEEADISWEEMDQLIFPVDVPEPGITPLSPMEMLGPVVIQLSTTISTPEGARTITRGLPQSQWPNDAKGKADCLKAFYRDAEWALINEWINKEGS